MFNHSARRPMMRLLTSRDFRATRRWLPLVLRSRSVTDRALHRPLKGGQDLKQRASNEDAGGGRSPQTSSQDTHTSYNGTSVKGSNYSSVKSVDVKCIGSNSQNRMNARDGREIALSDIHVDNNSHINPMVSSQVRNAENFEKSVDISYEFDSNSRISSAQPSISYTESTYDEVASLQASLNSRLSSPTIMASPVTPNSSGKDAPQSRSPHKGDNTNSLQCNEVVVSSKTSTSYNDGGSTTKGIADTPQAPHVSETALATVPKPKGVLGYIISRYTWYVERLQQSLESEMPKTFKLFRIFSVGIKAFVKDFTGYVRVLVALSFPSQRLEGLSLRDLELYHFMPYDMLKVFPVLVISAVPLGQNVALFLGYLFPRQLLCRHFWDLQQTHDFSMRYLRKRVYNARPVFRSLQAHLDIIEPLPARVRAQSAWHKLGSGVHPSREEVLALRPLFSGPPFSLHTIRRNHVNALTRLHGVTAPLGGRRRLREHARWLLCHDRALMAFGDTTHVQPASPNIHSVTKGKSSRANEYSSMDQIQEPFHDGAVIHTDGTVPSLTYDALTSADDDKLLVSLVSLHVTTLKTSLLLRGISPIGLDSSGMSELLLRWLTVSRHLTKQDYSLLLHLPVLLFYNHPTNLALIAPHTPF